MYATEECAKALLHLQQFIPGLNLSQELMPSSSTPVFNDNTGDDIVFWAPCPCCCHIQIQEYVVRESVMNGFVNVTHIAGHVNLADIFTKEDKDNEHYIQVRNSIMCDHQTDEVEDENSNSDTLQQTQRTGGCRVGSSPSSTSSTH